MPRSTPLPHAICAHLLCDLVLAWPCPCMQAQAREWYREDLVGKALNESSLLRESIFITTKVCARFMCLLALESNRKVESYTLIMEGAHSIALDTRLARALL